MTDVWPPWDWICEFCYKTLIADKLPSDWDWIFQSAVCPDCRRRAKIDGGYGVVKGGAYAKGPDPRAAPKPEYCVTCKQRLGPGEVHWFNCQATNTLEAVVWAARQALEFCAHRDQMNSVVHLQNVRWSPLTLALRDSLAAFDREKP